MRMLEAIRYPWRSIPKILTIVLVISIVLVAIFSLVECGNRMSGETIYCYSHEGESLIYLGIFALFGTALVAFIWLSGYSLDVIRHVYDGQSRLPTVHFGRNLAEGFMLLLSRVLWGAILLFLFGLLYENLSPWLDGHIHHALDTVLVAAFVFGALEFQVAMARFAVESRFGTTYELITNLTILFRNLRAFVGMIVCQIVLIAIYIIPAHAVVELFSHRNVGSSENDYLIVIGLACVCLMLSLLQHFSSLHLLSRFARKIYHRDSNDNLKAAG